MSNPTATQLLPKNALSGLLIGISVSGSADLQRLGFLETHFRLALGEIARCVVVSGGRLSYGGRLDPSGYTQFLVKELQRFSRRDRPLLATLSFGEHRSISRDQLRTAREEMGLFGQIECLDANGRVMNADNGRPNAGKTIAKDVAQASLTAMRRYLASICTARVLLGGRRTGYQGSMPGLLEEAIHSLEQERPLYLAAGFGGVTLDIARVLGVDECAWFPDVPEGIKSDKGLSDGLKTLSLLAQSKKWNSTDNGLTTDENRKLAATHRPSEIAALVSLGLGRKFSKCTTKK